MKYMLIIMALAAAPSGASADPAYDDDCRVLEMTLDFGGRAVVSMFMPGADFDRNTLMMALIRATASPDPMVRQYSDVVDGVRRIYEEECR